MIDSPDSVSFASTLHQLSIAPRLWGTIPEQLQAVWQPGDTLILLGEAAQGYTDTRLQVFGTIYLLQADVAMLGISSNLACCHILSDDEWATLVLKYNKHISWK
ncbi:hypothetical protein ACF3NA_04610 [Alkanindiges sp. WGS2144]|uniref:hypothetical protein n=1 Tax=Alkanindiges sp. WGS2144 TaxID=3366808 RepID=UPI003753240F